MSDYKQTGDQLAADIREVEADLVVAYKANDNEMIEYLEDQEPEITWHDWVVELKLGEVFMSAHWRSRNQDSPSEWDWCVQEAEKTFASACLLVGKRVRRGFIIEGSSEQGRTPRTQH